MNDQDYQLLIDLYETKNITKVAQQRYLSQPAVTKRIRRIEEELGCPLLIRSKKGVSFMPPGEAVVRYAREIVQLQDQIRNSVNSYQGIIGGTLDVGSSINYCRYRLPKALRRYQQLYPLVNVHITTGHSRDLYHSLLTNEISMAILRGTYAWTDGTILLSSEPICLVRSYDNMNRSLNEYTYIAHRTDPAEEKRAELWMTENNVVPPSRMWIDDIASCLEMAQAGIGWTIIPSICLDNYRGDAVPLKLKNGSPLLRNTYIYYRNAYHNLPQVRLFINILMENVAPQEMPSSNKLS